MKPFSWLNILKWTVTLACFSYCVYECIHIITKFIAKESFQAINELVFEELLSPSLTLCPGNY